MKRRLLSIFLSLTMILSMVPSVWAADETKQDDTDEYSGAGDENACQARNERQLRRDERRYCHMEVGAE